MRPFVTGMEGSRHRRPLQYTCGLLFRAINHHGDHGGREPLGSLRGWGINGGDRRVPDIFEPTTGFDLPGLATTIFAKICDGLDQPFVACSGRHACVPRGCRHGGTQNLDLRGPRLPKPCHVYCLRFSHVGVRATAAFLRSEAWATRTARSRLASCAFAAASGASKQASTVSQATLVFAPHRNFTANGGPEVDRTLVRAGADQGEGRGFRCWARPAKLRSGARVRHGPGG